MPDISMKSLLAAGVHFGHQTHRWNPKMKSFIFGPRNGIHIIDLEKTVHHTSDACNFVKRIAAKGEKILFVGTKRQAKLLVKDAAVRASMPFVTERWLGGTLTNFSTIRRGVERLEEVERMKEDGTYDLLPKKETVMLERKRNKLLLSVGGIREMKTPPGAIFVIDPETEKIAVREANRLGIPVVGVVDTNCNPDPIDYVIPANDDAIKSVSLFANWIADAVLEGSTIFEQSLRTTPPPAKTDTQEAADGEKPSGPVVERVVRRQLKIPTEIDYRDTDDEPTSETDLKAQATEEASSEEGANASEATPEDKDGDKETQS